MTTEIKKILFPTDLSKYARHAFNYAATIANRFGATISILHVMEELPTSVETQIANFMGEEKWKELKKKHELAEISREEEARKDLIGKKRDGMMIGQALDNFCREFNADDPECRFVTDEIVVKVGSVVEQIVEQAEASGSDMIVMAYYARNMLAEAMRGGVTRKVLQRSKKPVLLVPMPEDE